MALGMRRRGKRMTRRDTVRVGACGENTNCYPRYHPYTCDVTSVAPHQRTLDSTHAMSMNANVVVRWYLGRRTGGMTGVESTMR